MSQNPGVGSSSGGGTVSTKTPLVAGTPSGSTVGTSSSVVVASNAARKGLIVTNLSPNVVSLAIGTPAVLNSGITMTGYGSVWQESEYDFVTGDIYAIASAASSLISIQEFS